MFLFVQILGKGRASPVLPSHKPRANTSQSFIPFLKSLCESELLHGEDGDHFDRQLRRCLAAQFPLFFRPGESQPHSKQKKKSI
jgi:hypothetical protein